MSIERKIAKNEWRLNLPAELMSELRWRKGDTLILEIQNDELIIKNKNPRKMTITSEVKLNSNNEKKRPYVRPKKKTPCGIYERTKQKYIDNICKRCNPEEITYKMNGEMNCPKLSAKLEHNAKEVTKEIAKNLNNEYRIDIRDVRKRIQ